MRLLTNLYSTSPAQTHLVPCPSQNVEPLPYLSKFLSAHGCVPSAKLPRHSQPGTYSALGDGQIRKHVTLPTIMNARLEGSSPFLPSAPEWPRSQPKRPQRASLSGEATSKPQKEGATCWTSFGSPLCLSGEGLGCRISLSALH